MIRAIRVVVALFVLGFTHSTSSAQGASGLLLQLRPHAGDTLRLRLDQTIEMAKSSRASDAESGSLPDVASVAILARIAVESVDAAGAQALAMTDSVRMTRTAAFEGSPLLRAVTALQGQRVRFHLGPDGSTTVSSGGVLAATVVGSVFSQLPATLPKEAVAPGESWSRTIEIPLASVADARGAATLNANFRFDSLSKSGEYAYLSVRGRLNRNGPLSAPPSTGGSGGHVQTAGEVSGTLTIDRRRGWISEARSVVSIRTMITSREREAQRVRVKITQWMRVL